MEEDLLIRKKERVIKGLELGQQLGRDRGKLEINCHGIPPICLADLVEAAKGGDDLVQTVHRDGLILELGDLAEGD